MNRRMRVAVLWRPGRNVEWHNKFAGTDLPDDAVEEASIHRDGLIAAGYDAYLVRWRSNDLPAVYNELRDADLVFNASSLAEVAFLEAARLPYCGSGLDLVSLDKAARKKLLAYHGIRTAPFVVIEGQAHQGSHTVSLDEVKDGTWRPKPPLCFPMFAKPVRGRGSQGISDDSIVHDLAALVRQSEMIIERLKQGALVERYLKGREVTVGVIGSPPEVMATLEIEYNQAQTNSFIHKQDNEIMHCPARLTPKETERVREIAMATFHALGARDFARVDTILTDDGLPWVLEINTFAGLQIPTGNEAHLHASYIGTMATHLGWSMSDLVSRIVESALRRYGLRPQTSVVAG